MKNSSVHSTEPPPSQTPEGQQPVVPDWELPDGRHFVSRLPHMDPQIMFARCEEMLAYTNRDPEVMRRRMEERCRVEFIL